MAPLVLLAVLACPAPPAPRPEPPAGGRHGRLLADVGVAAAGSAGVALLKPDIRRGLFRDARLDRIFDNFAHDRVLVWLDPVAATSARRR